MASIDHVRSARPDQLPESRVDAGLHGHDVRRTEAKRPIQPLAGVVNDDDLGIGQRDEPCEDECADRTGAEKDDAVAVLDARTAGRVQPDGERLRHAGVIQCAVVGDRNEGGGGHGDVLGQATVDVETVRDVALAQVRPALEAAVAFAARDSGARSRSVSDDEPRAVVREGDDLADEFVPDHQRALMAADGVRAIDREHDRARLELRRVGSADPAAQHLHERLSGTGNGNRALLDTHVTTTVEHRGRHRVGHRERVRRRHALPRPHSVFRCDCESRSRLSGPPTA